MNMWHNDLAVDCTVASQHKCVCFTSLVNRSFFEEFVCSLVCKGFHLELWFPPNYNLIQWTEDAKLSYVTSNYLSCQKCNMSVKHTLNILINNKLKLRYNYVLKCLFRLASQIQLKCMFWDYVRKPGAPGINPRRHRYNIHTPHIKDLDRPVWGSNHCDCMYWVFYTVNMTS